MRIRPGVAVIAFLALGPVGAGCGRTLSPTALVNQPPQVDFTRFDVAEVSATDGAATASWTASDPEGGPIRYLVTEDLRAIGRGVDGWTPTVASQRTIAFRRQDAKAPGDAAREPHVLAVRAVDDRGAMSPAAVRAWFDGNIAPAVLIVSPEPSALLVANVADPVTIRWKGQDVDGLVRRPVSYRFLVLYEGNGEFPIEIALSNPDSLRRYYEPEFEGWTQVSGDTLSATFTNLNVGSRYLFVVTAFDEHGDYDPVFSLEKNMLYFQVQPPGFQLESLVLVGANLYVPMTAPSPTQIEVPVGYRNELHWESLAPWDISAFEYRVSFTGGNDWSPWFPILHPFMIGPLDAGVHRLQIEVRDEHDVTAQMILEIGAIPITFTRDLLIVDDTRRAPDQIVSVQRPDTMRAPSGPWPNAAELDTFLFARGGVRWRMTPPGTLSPPGVFAGYRFDTLGTRNGLEDPSDAIPLEFLGQYRHIVWIVDQPSALANGVPTSPTNPTTTLRWLSTPHMTNPLVEWVRSGGKLWAVGGGFGLASSYPWNRPGNDVGGAVFSSGGAQPDLVPGMLMYDQVHWRSEFISLASRAEIVRAPAPSSPPPYNFFQFPLALQSKTPATDPIYPNRASSAFYAQPLDLEHLRLPNYIIENDQSVLDTLMNARPFGQDTWLPVMTIYRGSENGQVVFSGHNIWGYRRSECAGMVDAVLGGVWGLERTDASLTATRRPRGALRQ